MVGQKAISKHLEWMEHFDIVQDSLKQFKMRKVVKNRLAMIDHLGDKHHAVGNVVATKVHINPKMNRMSTRVGWVHRRIISGYTPRWSGEPSLRLQRLA